MGRAKALPKGLGVPSAQMRACGDGEADMGVGVCVRWDGSAHIWHGPSGQWASCGSAIAAPGRPGASGDGVGDHQIVESGLLCLLWVEFGVPTFCVQLLLQ